MTSLRCQLVLMFAVATSAAVARGDDDMLGRTVFWKPGATAKVGTRPVNIETIPFGEKVGAVDGDWLWLKRAWVRQRDVQTAEQALDFYSEAIDRSGNDPAAYVRRAAIRRSQQDFALAIDDCDVALALDPRSAGAYANRGAAYESLGEHRRAIADCTEAVKLDRRFALAYQNRGAAWGNSGELAHAVNDFTEAIRLDPADALAHRNRGAAYRLQGQYLSALHDCRRAIALDGRFADAYNDLAWLEATCPDSRFRDGRKALANARTACELSGWKSAQCLGTLAAAHAELGEFDKAEETEAKAIALLPSRAEQRSEQQRLDQYARGHAFREQRFGRQPADRGRVTR